MDELTGDEFKLILRGLDSIKQAISSNTMLGDMFFTMMAGEKHKGKTERLIKERKEKNGRKFEKQEEQIVILKGKLLQMKQEQERNNIVSHLMSQTKTPKEDTCQKKPE